MDRDPINDLFPPPTTIVVGGELNFPESDRFGRLFIRSETGSRILGVSLMLQWCGCDMFITTCLSIRNKVYTPTGSMVVYTLKLLVFAEIAD